jgi:isoleucyl-tRNA synthetase
VAGDALAVAVKPRAAKCERCWHYREDVGVNPEHPTVRPLRQQSARRGEVRSKA